MLFRSFKSNISNSKLKTSLVPQVYLMKYEGGGRPETYPNMLSTDLSTTVTVTIPVSTLFIFINETLYS